MEDRNLEKLYNTLLENDELYIMFDGMKGEWEKDKKRFIREQQKLEEQIKDLNTTYYTLDEDEDE